MTAFSQTITNSLLLLGGQPTSKWGTMVWGEDKWADTEDLITETTKVITNTATFADTYVFSFTIVNTNTLDLSSETTSQQLLDGSGYNYVFRGGVTDAENRPTNTYTAATDASTSFTAASAASTTWSNA